MGARLKAELKSNYATKQIQLEDYQMDKMLVAVFEGVSALRESHAAGDVSLYVIAVMVKDGTGKITVKQVDEKAPAGTSVGFLSGGPFGLLGVPMDGPIG